MPWEEAREAVDARGGGGGGGVGDGGVLGASMRRCAGGFRWMVQPSLILSLSDSSSVLQLIDRYFGLRHLTWLVVLLRCSDRHQVASCSGDQTQSASMFAAMQENACSIDSKGVVCPQSGLGYSAGQNGTHGGGGSMLHQNLEGCMYMNQLGQMCGPYPPEQLYDGLSTGFLHRDLAIYAVFGGKMANPVSLGSLKQFLSQWSSDSVVATRDESAENKKMAPVNKLILPDVWLLFLSILAHHPLACLPSLFV